MYKLNQGPIRPISQPEDSPSWVTSTPHVDHRQADAPKETTTQHGNALGETPASRIPRSRLDKAGDGIAAHIRGYYSKTGIDVATMNAIKARSEGPRWWESEDRKERLKPRPLRDAAVHGLSQHFNNHYAHGHR